MSETTNGDGIGALAEALVAAQAEFPKVKKDRTATITGSRSYTYNYADLATVIEAVRKPLADHGLVVVQPIEVGEHGHVLHTMLLHTSGAKLDSYYVLANHERPQEMGSEITYARRYTLSALLGIASEDDDDGKAAQDAGGRQKSRPSVSREPTGPVITAPRDEIGRQDRVTPPATDDEVDEAFKGALEETPDARVLYAQGVRDCPVCKKPTLRKGAKQYGGGVYCNKNDGGCGYKWRGDVGASQGQTPGETGTPSRALVPGTGLVKSPAADSSPEFPREHLIAMCRQTVKALGMSARELQALRDSYTGGKMLDDAADEHLERLYLMLSDGEAVAQFRAELARGAA